MKQSSIVSVRDGQTCSGLELHVNEGRSQKEPSFILMNDG